MKKHEKLKQLRLQKILDNEGYKEETQEYIKLLEVYYDENKDICYKPISKEKFIQRCLDERVLDKYFEIYGSNVDDLAKEKEEKEENLQEVVLAFVILTPIVFYFCYRFLL